METIKTKNGKVLLRDGKVSFCCCLEPFPTYESIWAQYARNYMFQDGLDHYLSVINKWGWYTGQWEGQYPIYEWHEIKAGPILPFQFSASFGDNYFETAEQKDINNWPDEWKLIKPDNGENWYEPPFILEAIGGEDLLTVSAFVDMVLAHFNQHNFENSGGGSTGGHFGSFGSIRVIQEDGEMEVERTRYRWNVPDEVVGNYYRVTWDVFQGENRSDPFPSITPNTWEWTGGARQSDWYELPLPSGSYDWVSFVTNTKGHLSRPTH